MSIKEKVDQIQKELKIVKEKEEALLNEVMQEIFVLYPQVKNFSWTQYAPYFNDGDACTFSVNEYSLQINEENKDEEDEDYGDEKDYTGTDLANAQKDILYILNNFSSDIFESVYTDDGKVVVTKDGFTIEHHHHD